MRKRIVLGSILTLVAWGPDFAEPPGGSLALREMIEAGYEPPPAVPAAPSGGDCNGNGVPDSTDIAEGTSLDCNANDVPDECDTRPQFTTHVITNVADRAQSVVAADIDGDGDADVVAAQADDDTFAWWENTDGLGTFGPAILIDTAADFAVSVFPIDVDGDVDLDLIAASAFDDTVGWYENLDGLGSFGSRQVITTAAIQAWSVFGADVDGDGDADVVSASQLDNKVAWYENTDGAGGFGGQRVISTLADVPVSVFVADVDGDGDLDVLSASDGDDEIAWYENTDGKGSFGHQQVITQSADDASSVHAADIDGDGDLDALSSSFVDNEIAWYENLDGVDEFGPQQIISSTAFLALSVFAADMDGDGDIDALSASGGDNKIAWYENTDGAGTFGPEQVITIDAGGAGSVYAADIDGDGDLDALSASEGNNRLAWYENTGDDCNGNAIPDACEPDCNANGVADECDLEDGADSDCNANSIPDACDIAQGPSVDCSGNGVPDECEPDCNGNSTADSCDIDAGTSVDCTGNGVPDECEPDCNGNSAADSCDIDMGASADCTGNGVPDECEPDCNGNSTADSCEIDTGAAADCNGNSIPDECDVTIGGADDCDTDGVLDECETRPIHVEHVISTAADFTRSVFAADVDGDGDLDALSASFFDDKIAWYENTDGAGTFGPQQVISQAADGALSVHAADINGDLGTDVQSASLGDNEVAWYENTDAAGSFGPQQVISVSGIGAISVVAADLDGDGDLDVVAGSVQDDEIAWYENIDGRGYFGAQQLISTSADGVNFVAAADLDGDGDRDVLSASQNDDKVAWYENVDGFGSEWSERTITTAAAGASGVAAGDLDGDSDLDVLVASQYDDTVSWFENVDGLGTFGPRQVVSTTGNGPIAVFGVDVNGDGATDVLSASFFDSRIAWYENLGAASAFTTPRVISSIANGVYSVVAGDVDGDGDVDVLSASQDDDKIAWYENLSGDCNGNGLPDGCDVGSGTSGDCSGNGIPDECEPDCNGNATADSCDIVLGTSTDCDLDGIPDECLPSRDCNGNGIPDPCDAGCTACDADSDGCLDGADWAPGEMTMCGDTDGDSCDDCTSGFFDPSNDGPDIDGDGFCGSGDCAPFNAEIWAEPGAATGLTLSDDGATTTLRWMAPAPADRGSIFLRFDVLRSPVPYDFVGPSLCLETDEIDRSATDTDEPAAGALHHYLVRVENDCPGGGNLGRNSLGDPRSGRACP